MAVQTSAKKRTTKLERSHLDKKAIQNEAMGKDFDVKKFVVYLRGKIDFDAAARITSANVSRTIDGSSTLTVTIHDHGRSVLRSGALSNQLDVQLDGLWFRLAKVSKSGDEITLTFEDREVMILRKYKKIKFAKRQHTTRAEFILNLIREPAEYKGDPIPVVIPEVHTVQPIKSSEQTPTFGDAVVGKTPGIPLTRVPFKPGGGDDTTKATKPTSAPANDPFAPPAWVTTPPDQAAATKKRERNASIQNLTVKGQPASNEQIGNANTILRVGQSMGARRKVLVSAIMTAITESTLHNLSGGDLDSVGLFQQRETWGSFLERHDPATAARLYYQRAIPADRSDPTAAYFELCQSVQSSAYPERYATWRTEAERFTTAFGLPGGDNEGAAADVNLQGNTAANPSEYFYYRGTPDPNNGKKLKPTESSWDAIQRMAEEVNWRAFMVSGVFYFISDDDLLKSQPVMVLQEFDEGVIGVDGDYDTGKKTADITLTVTIGRWFAPPGSVVVLQAMGPWNGRWLVAQFDRSLFESTATITLKKKEPVLPEPAQMNIQPASGWGVAPSPEPGTTDPAQFGGIEGTDGSRNAVVKVALAALAEQAKNKYSYKQSRPYPASLFSVAAHQGIDCSAFVTLVYKEAGCQDPNGSSYDGLGYTGTLTKTGMWVNSPTAGDLVFYGGSSDVPGHVAVYVGGGQVVEIGSNNGILKLPINYRGDKVGIKSYLPGGALP